MRKEIFVGVGIELIAISVGVWQGMTGMIIPQIGWTIVVVAGVGGLLLITHGIRKSDITPIEKEAMYTNKWEHYNRLTDLIISIESAPHDKWSEIVADMHRELNAIGDKTINKYMRLYFPVLDEAEHVGIGLSRAVSQKIIDLTREHMITKYKR